MRHSKNRIAETRSTSSNRTSHSAGSVLLRCAIILSILVGSILGYWASATNEQVELPGVHSQVRIETLAETSSPEVLEELTEIAQASGGDIAVEIPTPTGRTVYSAGHKSDSWINDGFRGIPGSPHIEAHPLTDLPHGDYRQVFEFLGDKSLKDEILNYLDTQGIQLEELTSQQWIFLLGGTALGDITKLLLGFCIAFAAIGMILNSHAEAVRRLHGYSLWRSALYELKRASHLSIGILIAAIVIGAAAIAFLANASSALQVLKYQAIFSLLALATTALTVIITLLLMRLAAITPLLGGKLPGKSVITLVYIVRLGACVAVASLLIGTVNYTTEWAKQKDERALWEAMPTTYSISLSGARSFEDLTESGRKLASDLRNISSDGALNYARYIDAGLIPHSGMDRNTMAYNQTAAQNSLQGSVSKALEEAGELDKPLWLIPDDLSSTTNLEMLKSSLSEGPSDEKSYPTGDSSALTWEVGDDQWMNRAKVKDPLVVVYPNSQLPMDDRSVTAAVTQKDASLLNYDDYLTLQNDPMIGSFIRSANPMSETWAQHHQEMGRTVWIYAGGLVAAILLCLVATAAAAHTLLRVFHQRLRTTYIHGLLPRNLIIGTCLAEFAVIAAVFYYLWDRGAAVRAWSEGGALAGAVDPSIMAMLSVPDTAWWIMPLFIILTSVPMMTIWLGAQVKENLIHTRK